MYNHIFFWLLFDNKKYKGFKSMNKYVKSNVILFCFFILPTHSYANEIDVPFEMAWEHHEVNGEGTGHTKQAKVFAPFHTAR